MRSLPERNGKVSLDFVVTLPKELMGRCRTVEVTPLLHLHNREIPLQSLTIRGALFNRVQERNYWQYQQYLNVFAPDSVGRDWAYERFIRYPYPEGTRLDSVVSDRASLSYFYTQEIPTAATEGDKLLITLRGHVSALDHSEYRFPLSDTLSYHISSMLSFVDTLPRYVTRVIEKFAVVNDRNNLVFRTNSAEIRDDLGDNAEQLSRIESRMNEILRQREFHVDSIVLTASASPEGPFYRNEILARDRAHALRKWLVRRFPSSRIDTLISVRWIGEDWAELARLIRQSDKISHLSEVIQAAISRDTDKIDDFERGLRRRFPADYKFITENLYPQLRAVSFKYNLRRVGMVKDTIHTTVPDTLYARGLSLLKSRKYADALNVLATYRDRNTAICLMSLGRDSDAHEILFALPEDAHNHYLIALTSARLGFHADALRHFNRACELNSILRFRGRLDPEISNLLKTVDNENTN